MPLHILLILVVAGIGGITLALHLLGLSRVAPLDDAAARAGWLRHFPDDPAHSVTVAKSGRAALISAGKGRGVVWQLGTDTVARYTGSAILTERRGALVLRFPEYGTPRLRVALDDAERALWQQELAA